MSPARPIVRHSACRYLHSPLPRQPNWQPSESPEHAAAAAQVLTEHRAGTSDPIWDLPTHVAHTFGIAASPVVRRASATIPG